MLFIENELIYGLLAFLATMTAYNGQRLFKIRDNHPTPWLTWVNDHRSKIMVLVVLLGFSTAFVLFTVLHFSLLPLLSLLLATVFSLFYVVRIKGTNLRSIPFLKIHLIAVSWSLMVILFPMVNEGIYKNLIIAGFAHYLYILAVAIPFDIRDLKFDRPLQRTIPQVFGVKGAKIIALFALTLFTILILYSFPQLNTSLMFYSAVFIQAALILGMNEKQGDIYCAGIIDGAIALLGAGYWFA